ncbi:MAG: hypothetical protein ACI9R3_001715 [Verrucomicrobiales bacterium]|jgi:hypothetical protein
MLKKLLISGFALFVGMAAANAGNVSIQSSDLATLTGTLAVTDSDGTLLAVETGYVAAGTFNTLTDAQITAAGAANDWSALLNDFSQFGTASGVAAFAGIVGHDASAALADGDAFVGKPIYVAIGNTATLGGDPAGATQWLVQKSAATFAADNPVFEANTNLNMSTADQILVGTLGGPVNMAVLGGDTVGSLQLAGTGGGGGPVIPEPSTALLLLSGLGSMVFFRRRR